MAADSAAAADWELVADEPAAAVDPDGWPPRETRAVLLAAAGRRASDADAVRSDLTPADGAVGASRVTEALAAAKLDQPQGWSGGGVGENWLTT